MFFYLKHIVLVQVHDEEEQASASLHISQHAADPMELEDVTDTNYTPTRKDMMKVPLIPLTVNFGS